MFIEKYDIQNLTPIGISITGVLSLTLLRILYKVIMHICRDT
ncbi:MAG: hypothetical protein JETT_0984 [Candidatus Jettenia ecosi]|uniref:Uncharacterized protein n=1 Tax=Candidatus Jettenia ecosi TaxID=2494326 RepID=A0A533QDX0_9BACT|nr:MAG: hypothetical protein JETT_0984 [Candidatus Jettenia ecosi]